MNESLSSATTLLSATNISTPIINVSTETSYSLTGSLLTSIKDTINDSKALFGNDSTIPVSSGDGTSILDALTNSIKEVSTIALNSANLSRSTNLLNLAQVTPNASSTLPTSTVISTTVERHPHIGRPGDMVMDSDDADQDAVYYVVAVVLFYVGVLFVILALQMKKRGWDGSLEDDQYAHLIDREEMTRREMRVRHKLNVLKIRGLSNGYMLDCIPEHRV